MPGYLLGALLFMAAIVVFVFQNMNELVVVTFITWHSAKISVALVALIAAVGGALITFLVDSIRALKTGKKLRELTQRNKKLEKEVQAIKPGKSSAKAKASTDKSTVEEEITPKKTAE